jgi:hypothetical protein
MLGQGLVRTHILRTDDIPKALLEVLGVHGLLLLSWITDAEEVRDALTEQVPQRTEQD